MSLTTQILECQVSYYTLKLEAYLHAFVLEAIKSSRIYNGIAPYKIASVEPRLLMHGVILGDVVSLMEMVLHMIHMVEKYGCL